MNEPCEALRTVVNTWECDEMGHLNVRYYPARETEAVRVLLSRLGMSPAVLRKRGLRLRSLDKHIRFHREMRPGTAFVAHAGILSVEAGVLSTYCELRRARDGEVAATVIGTYCLCAAEGTAPSELDAAWLAAAEQHTIALPAHGAPRGVEPLAPRPAPSLQEAHRLGMKGEYLGLVDPEHVDEDGFAEPAGHIGRVSDGIQHFFLTLAQDRGAGIGGAVLEFRMIHRAQARRGDVIEIRSGLKAVAAKTRHFCHWVFDASSGACLATAEVVAVSFDLQTRKAIAFTPEQLAHMRTQVLPGISA